MDKANISANISNLRTVTIYLGSGLPKVFRVENHPMLSLSETPDNGLCVYAMMDGIKTLIARFAPGKWEFFEPEYLPREIPKPPYKPERVETPHPTVQNLDTLPVHKVPEPVQESPVEVTQPLPVANLREYRPDPSVRSVPVAMVNVGGGLPFSLGALPGLSPEERSQIEETNRRRSEEAVLVLQAKFAREEMARGRAARFGPVGERS